mgnify:CR=1 FL=1
MYKTKNTDLCPIPNDFGWGICLHMWKPGKEVVTTILNNDHVYTGLDKSDSPTSGTSDLQGRTSD